MKLQFFINQQSQSLLMYQFAASRGLLLSWCPDVAIKNSEFTFLLLSGCCFSRITPGHRMILGIASSSTKISMINLPMYSIRIFNLEIEGQEHRRFG